MTPRRHLPLLAGLVWATVLLAGCAAEDTATPDSTVPAVDATADRGSRDPLGECSHRYPGEILTASEAVVRFSPARICPGYVTVGVGTEVGFVNVGDGPSTVAIWEGIGADAATTPLVDERIEPGGRWSWTPPGTGVFTYRSDSIESFTGTIEVVD